MSPSRMKKRKTETVSCLSIKIDRHWLQVSWVPPIGLILHSCTHRWEITSRQVMPWPPFLAYIPSWWWIQPSLMRVGGGGGCTGRPPLFTHEQSCGVRSSWEGADTLLLFLFYPFLLCGCTQSGSSCPPVPLKSKITLYCNSIQEQYNNMVKGFRIAN